MKDSSVRIPRKRANLPHKKHMSGTREAGSLQAGAVLIALIWGKLHNEAPGSLHMEGLHLA